MGKRRFSRTDNTDAQQKPWLFKPGQTGNPAGRPKGSRNKLAEDFVADAYQKWQQHGPKALETMAFVGASQILSDGCGPAPQGNAYQGKCLRGFECR
jgi:hypothetical protein